MLEIDSASGGQCLCGSNLKLPLINLFHSLLRLYLPVGTNPIPNDHFVNKSLLDPQA